MTMRLSASSLAGTARTLVAVGTVSERFMFLTTAAAAPRSGDCSPAATGAAGVLAAGAAALLSAGLLSAGFAAGGAAVVLSACFVGAGDGVPGGFGAAAGAAEPLADGSVRSAAPTGLPGR